MRLLILLVLLPCFCFGQGTFQRIYDFSQSVAAIGASRTVQQTTDGGFILITQTFNHGAGATDFYLIKVDSLGNNQWAKTFGEFGGEEPADVIQTYDGGYALTGHTHNFSPTGQDAFVIKTDQNGDTLWTRTVGGMTSYEGFSIAQTPDSAFVVAGYANTGLFLFKLDNNGTHVWGRLVTGNGIWDRCISVRITKDGGSIVTGFSGSYSSSVDAFLMKSTPNGNLEWFKTYGGTEGDQGYSLLQTPDNGYMVLGRTWSFGFSNPQMLLLKTDSLGNNEWTKTYGGANYEEGTFISPTTDNGYLLSGISGSNGTGTDNITLIKIDTIGNVLWGNTYQKGVAMFGTYGPTAMETSDGGIIVGGIAYNNTPASMTTFLFKTDNTGSVGCDVKPFSPSVTSPVIIDSLRNPSVINTDTINTVAPIITTVSASDSTMCDTIISVTNLPNLNGFTIYPNPTTGVFTVQGTATDIQIFDLFGRLVLRTNATEIDMGSYPSGIYIVRAGEAVRKLILH